MTQTAENNQWYKGRRPLVNDYLKVAKQVEEGTASRGHLYRPGFLGGMITEVESGLKYKLSDLNYQIVAEAIERELKQTGFDYDIAYKEATIAWQLEKTQLMTLLEQELADGKYLRELTDQDLARLEIQINLRKLVIMAAKTAIDVDMEGYRQELTRVDQSTFSAEDALLNAKLLTAQKKLEVIPYIEIVLEKQALIITAEENNATRKESLITKKEELNDKRLELITARELIADAIIELIAAKQALVLKKESLITAKGLVADQETINIGYLNQYIATLTGLTDVQQDLIAAKKALIPFINDRSLAQIAYAAELDAWVIVKNTIAGVKEQIAGSMETRADLKGDLIDAKVDLNELKLDLQEANINLEIARMTGRSDLLTQQTANQALMLTEKGISFDAMSERKTTLFDAESGYDLYREKQEFASMEEINDYVIPLEKQYISDAWVARINERGKTAEIAANKELTSSLVHLLA